MANNWASVLTQLECREFDADLELDGYASPAETIWAKAWVFAWQSQLAGRSPPDSCACIFADQITFEYHDNEFTELIVVDEQPRPEYLLFVASKIISRHRLPIVLTP